MHIGFFTNAYTPSISGVARSVSCFRKALTELGNNVFIFSPQVEDSDYKEPFIFNYPAFEIPQILDLPFVIPISTSIDHIFPSLKVDIIHSHHPVLLGQTAAHKASIYNLPLVFTFHSLYWEYSRYTGSLGQDFIKDQIDNILVDYLKKCHHIITPSESLRKILYDNYGCLEKVSTIPTGIELSNYNHLDKEIERKQLGWKDEIILISVGRLALEKTWDTLLEACALVMNDVAKVRLVLLGDGSERKKLRKEARSLGIGDRVEMPGVIDLGDVANYLTAADIFCFASVSETQGLVTLEAMAPGLPIAAIDGSGTRDILQDGIQGFMSINDSSALSEAIRKLVMDGEMRQKMGQAARQKARMFEIRHQAQKLLDVYAQAQESNLKGEMVLVDCA